MKKLFSNIESFRRGPTFIPRRPTGAGVGGGAGGVSGLLKGLACPLLCLGCLAALALVGLFATMIGAAAYMSMKICFEFLTLTLLLL